MSIDFASFDIAELKVLDARDAIGLPEMGASIEINYVGEMDDSLGETAPEAGADVSVGSCSCCCCC
ncbi:MAG TPA: hypothetical protein VGF84_01300 [Micromonosporaceae bacterium]|jgi:hypothetical protein